MSETYPRMQLLSFEGKPDSFRDTVFDVYYVSSWVFSADDASSYGVWESETFGDRWEVWFSLKRRPGVIGLGPPWQPRIILISIDNPRGLRLGETFRAVQKKRMTEEEKKTRREQIASGALHLQIGVSDEELGKAVRELVRSAVALPLHKGPKRKYKWLKWPDDMVR